MRARTMCAPRVRVMAYMVVASRPGGRREIVKGWPTRMTRFVVVTGQMRTGIKKLTGVSVSLYVVSGSSTGSAIEETEIKPIPKTTIMPRKCFTEGTPNCWENTLAGLGCQRET